MHFIAACELMSPCPRKHTCLDTIALPRLEAFWVCSRVGRVWELPLLRLVIRHAGRVPRHLLLASLHGCAGRTVCGNIGSYIQAEASIWSRPCHSTALNKDLVVPVYLIMHSLGCIMAEISRRFMLITRAKRNTSYRLESGSNRDRHTRDSGIATYLISKSQHSATMSRIFGEQFIAPLRHSVLLWRN